MNNRWGLNLALLLTVVILGALAYIGPGKGPATAKLLPLMPAQVNRIKVEIAGEAAVLLERKGQDWIMTAPRVAPANTHQIMGLLTLLDATSNDRLPAEGLARFDLNEPRIRISFGDQTLAFGAVNELSREQYVLSADGVHLVPMRFGAVLPRDTWQLVSRQLFAPDETPIAFDLGRFAVVLADGGWRIEGAAADANDIQQWVEQWRTASALSLRAVTGGKPEGTIRVKLKNGRDFEFAIVQSEPVLILARGDRQIEYQFAAPVSKQMLAPPASAVGRP